MRGVLKRSRPARTAPGGGVPEIPALDGRDASGAGTAAEGAAAGCGLLTCPQCGLRLETLALRCPRCRAGIPLGCDGDCRACGKA